MSENQNTVQEYDEELYHASIIEQLREDLYSLSFSNNYEKEILKAEIEKLKAENAKLKAENAKLKAENDALNKTALSLRQY